jgi:KipI family sensor histidine kinase inhibitor
MKIAPYGTQAVFVDLEIERAPDRAARTHALGEALREAWPEADVVLGAGTVVIVGAPLAEVERIAGAPLATKPHAAPREHAIEVVYDGPDLASVAEALGITPEEAVARHAGARHVVELLGFLPGFAYLSAPAGAPLPAPRRPSPRPRIAAGSVAVAASFSGIYPFASPGGWNLVGRVVDAVPFDPSRDPPVLFAPGDAVRFVPRESPPAASPSPEPIAAAPSAGPALLVTAALAPATVQDRGRIGQLGRGIPPSGPLDPEMLGAANIAAGNDPGAAAIEVPLGSLEVEARGGAAVVSIDGEPAVRLAEGERLRVPAGDRAVRYLAVRGGVAVPAVLGARATLFAAGLGGLAGRALRKRDLLPIGGEVATITGPPAPITERGALEIDPGPHVARFPSGAYDALLSATWTVSRLGDRVGVRLEGARIPREGPDLALPVPMIRGAVEVATDGTPIVLGPDHPTTGGYPVLAVLRPSAQAALARRKPGEVVRFCEGR